MDYIMQEADKDSSKNFYNFFSKQKMTEITPQSSWGMRAWAMALYTVYQIFKLFSRVSLRGLAIFMIGFIITSGVTSYFSHRAENNKAQVAQVQTMQKQKMALIKEMDETRFSAILAHIKLVKEKELEQINKNYWAAVFINEKITPLSMERVTRETTDMIKKSNQFYDSRMEDMNKTYQLIKKDKIDLITSTYDGDSPIDKIITWDNISQVKTISIREDIANNSYYWMRHLNNPVALADYLEANKAVIASKKIF